MAPSEADAGQHLLGIETLDSHLQFGSWCSVLLLDLNDLTKEAFLISRVWLCVLAAYLVSIVNCQFQSALSCDL